MNPSFASFGYTYNPVENILAILDQVTPAEDRMHTYAAFQRLKTGGTLWEVRSSLLLTGCKSGREGKKVDWSNGKRSRVVQGQAKVKCSSAGAR